MKFYLGTHRPHWLGLSDYSLFVSYRRLRDVKTLPKARAPWALDSGGFTEISMNGEWTYGPEIYAAAAREYMDEIGQLAFVSPQDWMCEPWILEKTGKSVAEHQALTVENYLDLRMIDAELPIVPVLQGWELDDYLRCMDLYKAAGVDLTAEAVVGIGSVCRRQATGEIEQIISTVGAQGVRLHGFGVKKAGLLRYSEFLDSADSMAWSFTARHDFDHTPDCTHRGTCQNCIRFACWWRDNIIASLPVDDRNAIRCPSCSTLAYGRGPGIGCTSCWRTWERQVDTSSVRPLRRKKPPRRKVKVEPGVGPNPDEG